MRSSSGCCPGLGKPLGFQPVFACVSKSLIESLTIISFRVLRVIRGFLVAYGKKSLGEIFFKEWPEARNNLPLSLQKQNL